MPPPPKLELLAQEATQTAAVKVLIKLRDFRNESLFATWWTQVAINAYIDLVRQRARFVALPITGDPDGSAVPPAAAIEALLDGNSRIDPSQIVLSLELVAVLQRAIRQLTPKERSVFVLMHLHLLSLLPDGPSPAAFPGITEVNERTVAAYLRMPVGTVRGLNYQAVVKIRKALWQYLQAKPGEEGRAA
jgi:RNA polymerase sigma factor (sigma-70 family)